MKRLCLLIVCSLIAIVGFSIPANASTPTSIATKTATTEARSDAESEYIGAMRFVNTVLLNSMVKFDKLFTEDFGTTNDFIVVGIGEASLWATMNEYADLIIFPPDRFRIYHEKWAEALDGLDQAASVCILAMQTVSRGSLDLCLTTFRPASFAVIDEVFAFEDIVKFAFLAP